MVARPGELEEAIALPGAAEPRFHAAAHREGRRRSPRRRPGRGAPPPRPRDPRQAGRPPARVRRRRPGPSMPPPDRAPHSAAVNSWMAASAPARARWAFASPSRVAHEIGARRVRRDQVGDAPHVLRAREVAPDELHGRVGLARPRALLAVGDLRVEVGERDPRVRRRRRGEQDGRGRPARIDDGLDVRARALRGAGGQNEADQRRGCATSGFTASA